MDLALFDFDGTITTRGAYPDFLRMAVRPRRKYVSVTVLLPFLIGYRTGVVSELRIRKLLSGAVFWREDPERIRQVGARFAVDALPAIVRPNALERIEWHKARGDRVVVVSASLDAYLIPWCDALGIEVICTQLEIKNGRHTGRYVRGDCDGAEKARRIRERIALEDYATIYAYGDREEDREMLTLANRRYVCWEEVQDLTHLPRSRADASRP
jgi:phosphatidylglycerophosphatase C